MNKKFIIPFLLLFIATPCLSFGNEDPPDYLNISSMLFPETSSWGAITRKVDGDTLMRIKPKLIDAYSKSKIGKEKETESCSFIERVFSEEFSFPQGFFSYDADDDGAPDILYTGSPQCRDGNSTVIWFSRGDGYKVEQDVFWDVLTLRIKPGQPVRLASVSIGCCGSDEDDYFVGKLDNVRRDGVRSITTGTVLPEKQGKRQLFIADIKEFSLRSSPIENDDYDPDRSAGRWVAVLGNILSKYLPGCTGQVIGEKKSENQKLWFYVSLDEKCNSLRTYISSSVSAGWVAAEDISLTK